MPDALESSRLPATLVQAFTRLERDREDIVKEWVIAVAEDSTHSDLIDASLGELAAGLPSSLTILFEALRGDASMSPESRRATVELLARDLTGEAATRRVLSWLSLLQSVLSVRLCTHLMTSERTSLDLGMRHLARAFSSLHEAALATLMEGRGQRYGRSLYDPSTGLLAFQQLEEALERLVAIHHRYGAPFAIVTGEIDVLAEVDAGPGARRLDEVVSAVSATIREQTRTSDIAAWKRPGEFSVLAPKQSSVAGRSLAERLGSAVATLGSAAATRVELAIGIAGCPEDGTDPRTLLEAAARAVARARSGEEKIVVAQERR